MLKKRTKKNGFAIPISMGLGLIMILIAASMIVRSQGDQTTALSQKENARSLNTAETGITRIQSFLNNHRFLITKNLNQWVSTINQIKQELEPCNTVDWNNLLAKADLYTNQQPITVDSNDNTKGQFVINSYEFNDQLSLGLLNITAQTDSQVSNINQANSRLEVDLPINSNQKNTTIPALWVKLVNLNPNQKITGNIYGYTCPNSSDTDGLNGADNNNITVDTANIPTGKIKADPFIQLPTIKNPPTGAITLPPIKTDITLPRSGDTPINGVFHYDVQADTNQYSIALTDSNKITINITGNQKINLYTQGNIDLAGAATVNSNVGVLRIYGSTNTTSFTIKDSASITALINLPNARGLGISGTPLGTGINGGLWIKEWDSATNNSNLIIKELGTWEDWGISTIEQPTQLIPINYWRKQQAP